MDAHSVLLLYFSSVIRYSFRRLAYYTADSMPDKLYYVIYCVWATNANCMLRRMSATYRIHSLVLGSCSHQSKICDIPLSVDDSSCDENESTSWISNEHRGRETEKELRRTLFNIILHNFENAIELPNNNNKKAVRISTLYVCDTRVSPPTPAYEQRQKKWATVSAAHRNIHPPQKIIENQNEMAKGTMWIAWSSSTSTSNEERAKF